MSKCRGCKLRDMLIDSCKREIVLHDRQAKLLAERIQQLEERLEQAARLVRVGLQCVDNVGRL